MIRATYDSNQHLWNVEFCIATEDLDKSRGCIHTKATLDNIAREFNAPVTCYDQYRNRVAHVAKPYPKRTKEKEQ